MEFNEKEYSNSIDKFLMEMDKFSSTSDHDFSEALYRLCRLLRVGAVHATLYQNQLGNNSVSELNIKLYDSGEADFERYTEKQEITGIDDVIVFKAFKRLADTPWTDTENEKINIMLHMIFIFYGRLRISEQFRYMTYHDKEFDTYNEQYFFKMAKMHIENKTIGSFGACSFNIRRMSAVNQLLGRDCGTKIIIKYVKGLENMLSGDECVCRVNGDSFIMLFYKARLGDVQSYLSGMEIEYNIHTHEKIQMSAVGGFFMIPEDITSPEVIVDRISQTLNIAKNVKNEQFLFYDDDLNVQLKNSKIIETKFPQAMLNEEFVVYYQPKVYLKEYRLAGAEALCRWIHKGEIMYPSQFVPTLEQSQSICRLDFYMLEHVCADIRKWLDEGRKVVKISVNMSRRHMGDTTGLLKRIISIIDKYHVPHEYIEIELTETTTDVSFSELKEIVTGLQKQGISTSVDDFGVGYSSLNLIKELPWNVLKIDKCFLEQTGDDRGNNVMLKHVIAMAQDLGMEVIVEGVETIEHIKLLKENNCYLAQGFYFDEPLPKSEFIQRMSKE